MRKFKSVKQAQRFLEVHAALYNLFNLGRHLTKAEYFRKFRQGAFNEWERAVPDFLRSAFQVWKSYFAGTHNRNLRTSTFSEWFGRQRETARPNLFDLKALTCRYQCTTYAI